MCELTYMLIFCLFKNFALWLRRSGLLTFFSSLVIQESLINCANERLRSRILSHCENILSFCLSASHPLESSSKRHRLKPFEVSPHDCEQSFAANLRTVIAYDRLFSHPIFSWARNRRNGVRFPKHPQNVSRSFRCSGPTFHFWTRLLTSFVVELGLTGPTSISWYVRTTRPESLAAYQSNDSALSVRPRIL